MIAGEIALALGGAHRSGAWWRCRCPVHGSACATLALRGGDRGLVVVCHAGCTRADILRELCRRGLANNNTGISLSSLPHNIRTDDQGQSATQRKKIAEKIWRAAQPAAGSPVDTYLRGRGITIVPSAPLRYSPALRRTDGTRQPAMVACVRDVDGNIVGLHRTWLTRDSSGRWRRLDRASLGPIGGGAVRLAQDGVVEPDEDVGVGLLLVSEGIETGLAAMQATGIATWAALSTSGLVALQLPCGIVEVTILADNDRNGAGVRAARTAAARWLAAGRQVRIAMPPMPGTDFNNVLLGAVREVRDVAA